MNNRKYEKVELDEEKNRMIGSHGASSSLLSMV